MHTRICEHKSPAIYIVIPYFGTKMTRNINLTIIPEIFCIQVAAVSPRPLRILPIVTVRYINGHSHARIHT